MKTEQNTIAEPGPTEGASGRPFHWLFSWRLIRRGLFVLACLATLTGLFYAVEDWRGKRAWEKCRHELEAKSEVLDWNALIPPPVPDDQNIFKAPKMAEWFVKKSWLKAFGNETSQAVDAKPPFSVAPGWDAKKTYLPPTDVEIAPSGGPLSAGHADAVLRFDDPAARAEAARLLLQSLGPCARDVWGRMVIARPLDQIEPLHLALQADTVPSVKALAEFLPGSAVPQSAGAAPDSKDFQVTQTGSNTFRVSLKDSVVAATEYLVASEPAVPDLDVLRRALERPCARMDSDYQRPFERPIPNFIRLRTVAQMLAQRAQCYLLLGQPKAAWHELALVRDMCHMLEAKPGSDCPMLVETMIDVAITGLYTGIIQDGLRLHVWREPELAAIQKQLADVNLVPLLRVSFNAERAASCSVFESTPPAELKKLFFLGRESLGLWQKLKEPTYLLLTVAPRGWMYQNMCAGAPQEQVLLEALDVPNNQVLPGKLENLARQVGAAMSRSSPYTFLAAKAIPNFLKATQTMTRNQTMVNEAYLACGLERYRLAHGQYPETLEALVPQFADRLPHDIIGGQPLKYHRTKEGQFVLYSIGWNEKDDGGVPGKTIAEGDWVWP